MLAAPTRTSARIGMPSATCMARAAAAMPVAGRGYHDLVIKRKTGQAMIKAGPFGGGRSSTTGHVATVFGCTGFLGRYVVNRLARKGTQVVVPYRDEDRKRHLRVAGDLGQVVPLEFNIRSDEQIVEALRHSDVVYNLLGRWWETKNFSFEDVNINAAERIAKLADQAGCARLIHVSHLNATEDAPSKFLRSKWEGEQRVKAAFPGATIVRPGPMYGHEDRLLQSIARNSWTWHVNWGETKLRPTHVHQVAQALEIMMDAEETSFGQTFSLTGPKSWTVGELRALVHSLTFQKPHSAFLNIPEPVIKKLSEWAQYSWFDLLSPDELQERFTDDLPDLPGSKTFADLGIIPDDIEDTALPYVRHYRGYTMFEQPVEGSGERLVKDPYRVIP